MRRSTPEEAEEFQDYDKSEPKDTNFIKIISVVGALALIAGVCLIVWLLIAY